MPQLETGSIAQLGVMNASKWLRFALLVDVSELQTLLENLGQVHLINLSPVHSEQDLLVTKEQLLKQYKDYIDLIKAGKSVDHAHMQKAFALHMSYDMSSCYQIVLKEGALLYAKERAPGVRLRLHNFSWDGENGQTHSNVHAKNGITWGLEFAYPQIFASSIDEEVVYVLKSNEMPNNALFQQVKKWVRQGSKPVRFLYEGSSCVSTIRLGKEAQNWVGCHEGLRTNKLEVSL